MRQFLEACRFVLAWSGRGLLAAVLLALHVGAAAQPARTFPGSPFAVFPPIASAGERVWLIGHGLEGTRVVWVGGHAAKLTADTPAGWYAFQVPESVPGGFQGVSVQGPARPGSPLLSIMPRVSSDDLPAQALTAYLRADAQPGFQARYTARVERLAEACARLCPAELTETLRAMTRLEFRALTPLSDPAGPTSPRTPPVHLPALRSLPSVLPATAQALAVSGLDRVLKAPNASTPALGGEGLCSQLAGDVDISTLPPGTEGRVIALLNLLFWGDLGIDPIAGGHPTATAPIPFQGDPPLQMLEDPKVLGPLGRGGQGVTIHVLDTASPSGDPFTMTNINYYNEVYPTRPGHGSIVGAIAQAVAPDAKVVLSPVCTLDGGQTCRTLAVVRALCEVAREARQGGKHVVNLSLGGPYPSLGVLLALRDLATQGVPTAASYGNRDDCHSLEPGDRCSHYPADWSGTFALSAQPDSPTMLLSVAGWDVATREYATYNRTTVIPWAQTALPSVLAPGEFWFQPPGTTESMPYFGTSFAAPVVSGLLANWLSCRTGVPYMPLITRIDPVTSPTPLPANVLKACP
ncbi:hypothetical protein E7T09_14985 [Deinococcus sp. KSM4-11]|uniref:S8 family serine peptidase n=1 Tax=Deinococcus sp. KSM4-11 TaxID=2568654 RepID=UPI0010A3FAA6|nr:S8 family serine peptidase [Deinococcus sp. KSM4-11]THF85821.1 hypothetical protein E7T09_14985 [Deinococcus sp. KSM4-11]